MTSYNDSSMSPRGYAVFDGKFRAWIEVPEDKSGVVAAFVGVPPGSNVPLRRLPATKHCGSQAEAKQWVEREALAIGGVHIEWVGK
jgi:hypothetical protein